jgi:hypothetical protein
MTKHLPSTIHAAFEPIPDYSGNEAKKEEARFQKRLIILAPCLERVGIDSSSSL